MLRKQRVLAQTVEDAELAVSVMQAKLIESQTKAREAEEQARTVRRDADIMRGDLEQQVCPASGPLTCQWLAVATSSTCHCHVIELSLTASTPGRSDPGAALFLIQPMLLG